MKPKFIYDVKTSRLFDIDGTYIKTLFCPKAKHWNQLIADDPLDRSRGCNECGERVINLDDPNAVISISHIPLKQSCVYLSRNSSNIRFDSSNVIFLDDEDEVPELDNPDQTDNGLLIIKTARSIDAINRAAGMGYWPDVRLIEYRDKNQALNESDKALLDILNDPKSIAQTQPLQSKFSVGQSQQSGRIKLSGDFRKGFAKEIAEPDDGYEIPNFLHRQNPEENVNPNKAPAEFFKEIIPFTYYYPNYQRLPIAAYLIPPDINDGTKVIIEDPIEDIVGSTWNQGNVIRAYEVNGWIKDKKVIIDYELIMRNDFIG